MKQNKDIVDEFSEYLGESVELKLDDTLLDDTISDDTLLGDIEKAVEFDNIESDKVIESKVIESVEIVAEKQKLKSKVDIYEYQRLLGFTGIPFDFDKLSEELEKGLKVYDFSEYIETEEKEGISNLLYVLMILNNCQTYNTPFYPAEDKILENYYKDVGYRVVEIMKSVIPNYEIRPYREYVMRIREKKYKTPHPIMGFDSWDNDISLIRSLYSKVKKGPTKYFFWLDSFDLLYMVEKEGLGQNTSKKVKEIVDLNLLDLKPYITAAEKLKEVVFHDIIWTSDRHDIFKNEFKNIGLDIVNLIDGVTVEACKEHSLKYKIYQNYTTKEVERMKEVYLEGGLESLFKEFSYRTEEALKFKVEEQGWDKLVTAPIISEEELQMRVNEMFDKQKDVFIANLRREYIDEFRKEELEIVKMELEETLRPTIKKEVVEEVSKIMVGVLQEMKVLMPDIVKKSNINDLPNVLPQKISVQLETFVKSELNKI